MSADMIHFSEIKLDSTQAAEFARIIHADISEYIRLHPKEYEEFLRNEETKEKKGHEENDTTGKMRHSGINQRK